MYLLYLPIIEFRIQDSGCRTPTLTLSIGFRLCKNQDSWFRFNLYPPLRFFFFSEGQRQITIESAEYPTTLHLYTQVPEVFGSFIRAVIQSGDALRLP